MNIEEMEALDKARTQGKWYWSSELQSLSIDGHGYRMQTEDSSFIAACSTWVPLALEELQSSCTRIKTLECELDDVKDWYDALNTICLKRDRQIAILRETLRFYAGQNLYEYQEDCNSRIHVDNGQYARDSLQAIERDDK